MLVAAFLLAGLSLASMQFNPLNKRLWSLSFVLVTGSAAYATMALAYIVVDVAKLGGDISLLRLLIVAGKNAIVLYIGHSLITGLLPWYLLIQDEKSRVQVLGRLLWTVFVWLLVAQWMAKRRLFIKV